MYNNIKVYNSENDKSTVIKDYGESDKYYSTILHNKR